MKKIMFLLTLVATCAFVQTGCKKDAQNTVAATSEDAATNQDDLEQIDADADLIIEERGGGGNCPTLTWTDSVGTFPNTLTIDFGASCTRPDGRVVNGKIIVTQSAEMRTAGAIRTITFDGFAVDDVAFAGSRTRTNNGLNAAGLWSHTNTANAVKRTFADGTTTEHTATHTITMVTGASTPLVRLDDSFEIVGSGTFVGRAGNTWTSTITTPLLKKYICRWIVSGTADITRNGETGSIDYGNGDCDREAQITTANGNVITIRLRR